MKNTFDQAITQLILLGYQEGDRVYVRCLPPKNLKADSLLAEKLGMRFWHLAKNKFQKSSVDGYLTLGKHQTAVLTVIKPWGETVHQDGWGFLQQANEQGYGVYYVVNPGGKNSGAITEGRSLFYECDGITKSEQWERKKALEKELGQQASLVIETKKSLHVYFVLDKPLAPTQWSDAQKRLIKKQQSDPCIHNPDRLMRLAGFYHQSLDDDKAAQWEREGGTSQNALVATPVKIVQQEATVFTLAELDKILPALDQPKQRQSVWLGGSSKVSEAYDIRSFASYLDGFDDEGRSGWSHAKCPHHNGESDDSLHIEQASGAFKCHGGCNSKDVYHSALDLAKSRGYRLLEREAKTDVEKRDRAIANRQHLFLKFWGDLQKDFRLSPSKSLTINTYQGYAPTVELDKKSILMRGWLGSGKTEATIRSLLPHKDKQIVWISGRNGLLRQTAERLGKLGLPACHFQDDPGLYREMLRDGHPGIYLMCPDSLKDYAVKHCDWKDTILVIDEFSGIRREVLGKTEIMPEFERLLSESQTLVAIDAFLGDIDARIISRYRPGKRAIYDQAFSPSPKPIQWLETRTKDGKISMSHDGIAYGLLRQWVKEGHRIAIASDTKRDAKICARFLKQLGVKVVLCHSETVGNNQCLLPAPDGYLAETGAQVLIYSPTAQSGLDVQTHFDRGLALYNGVISPHDFLQMMGRCRLCDQWAVSAPRRSLNSDCLVPSLDSPKVLEMGEKLEKTFADLEIESSAKNRGWGLWQGITKEIEKSFHSEYLQQLLSHFFKSVETVEVECDRSTYRADSKAIKQEEAALTLSGDLAYGQTLIWNKQAPSTDAQVWDIVLAEQHDRYPKIWNQLLELWSSTNEEQKKWAIEFAIVASSPRIEKLKHWVSATGKNAGEDLEALQDQVKRRFTSYTSQHYKALQFRTLFQELGLKALATVQKGKSAIAHTTHFRETSTRIGELWEAFQRSAKLTKLFPFIDTQTEFFAIVKRCMSFHGYQSEGKTIRQESEELHPNGNDRHGKARFSPSQSVWFSGWLIMEESGNKLFQENFWWIVEAISDRLTLERENRQQWLERQQAPPMAA